MNMKKFCVWIVSLLAATSAFAQAPTAELASQKSEDMEQHEEGWTHGGNGAITFNQVGLKNWSAGGDPSISFLLAAGYYANFRKGKHLWKNTLGAEYGVQKIKGEPFRKSSDRLQFTSKYGFQIDKEGKWFFATLVDVKSQFSKTGQFDADGNRLYTVSRFASPITLEYSIGIDYVPNEFFSLYMSPLAAKTIIVKSDIIAARNLHGNNFKNVNNQFGALLVANYNQEVYKNITIGSSLKLYKDYLAGPAKNIDVDWQTNIGLKVNDFIAASIFLHMIWDWDVDTNPEVLGVQRNIQFKEVIGVGFSYSFQAKKDKSE